MEGRDHLEVENDPIVPPKSPPKPPPTPPPTPPPVPETPHTYIVQIPRDQIYRVPPPEHSKIAESYRTLPHQQKRKCVCGCLFWGLIISLVVLAILGGIMFGIFRVLYKPKAPAFNVTDLLVKKLRAPHMNPSYEFSLMIDNPNERMGVSYENGGTTMILYDEKTIGEGEFHVKSQDAKESVKVNVTLDGLKTALPSKVEKSMKDKDAKLPVTLSLEIINVPIKLMGIKSFSKKLNVTCDIKVNTLATGTKIRSQKCSSEFEN